MLSTFLFFTTYKFYNNTDLYRKVFELYKKKKKKKKSLSPTLYIHNSFTIQSLKLIIPILQQTSSIHGTLQYFDYYQIKKCFTANYCFLLW